MDTARDLVQRNHEALWVYLAGWQGWRVHVEPNLAWCESSMPHEFYNKFIRLDFTSQEATNTLQQIVASALGQGVPVGFWLHDPEMEEPRRSVLDALGFQVSAEGFSVVRSLPQPLSVPKEKTVELVRVLEPSIWSECARVIGMGFSLPQYVTDAYAQQMRVGLDASSPLSHFAAVEKGAVLACGSLFQEPSGVAGLYSLAVRPDARGRGLGRAVVVHALNEARQRGCHNLVLRSTVGAFNLYASLGFSPVARFQVLVARPASHFF